MVTGHRHTSHLYSGLQRRNFTLPAKHYKILGLAPSNPKQQTRITDTRNIKGKSIHLLTIPDDQTSSGCGSTISRLLCHPHHQVRLFKVVRCTVHLCNGIKQNKKAWSIHSSQINNSVGKPEIHSCMHPNSFHSNSSCQSNMFHSNLAWRFSTILRARS